MKIPSPTGYLNKQYRDEQYVVTDRQMIIEYLRRQNIPAHEKIIDFQLQFSGLELKVNEKPGSGFNACLFSIEDIRSNTPVETIDIIGNLYFSCGYHASAPFLFVLDTDGGIGTYDPADHRVNIISSSFEKFAGTFAVEDALARRNTYEHAPYYDLVNQGNFESQTLSFIPELEISDKYNTWLSGDNLILHIGTWYDREAFFVHVYGENEELCEQLIRQLKKNNAIT